VNEQEINANYPAPEPAAAGEPSPEAKAAEAVQAYLQKNPVKASGSSKSTPPQSPEKAVRQQIKEQQAPARESAPAAAEPQSYKLLAPEGIPSDVATPDNVALLDGFSSAISGAGVPRAAAELMLDVYVDAQTEIQYGVGQYVTGDEYTPEDAARVMRRIWGSDFEANLKKVNATVKSLGPGFESWIEYNPLGNSPAALISLLMYSDTRLTKAQAQAELNALYKDKSFIQGKAGKWASVRAKLLGRIAYQD
jgi:hypothetical protein